jgi:prepilin-type N-terminal cleavage/methylation domain-containing protein
MRAKGQEGFTLGELMTVVVVMAVLMAIGVPQLRDHVQRSRLRRAAEVVDADLRQARWTARMTGQVCRVVFNAGSGTYTINGSTFARIPEGVRFGVDPSVTGKPKQPYSAPPSDGVSFDMGGSKNQARFYPNGVVAPTGSVFLTNGKETMAVTVAITGRPKLWRSGGGKTWVPL